MLREMVVRLLETEEGADEVLRRAWARLEATTLPRGQDARTTLLTLIESEAHTLRQELQPRVPAPIVPLADSSATDQETPAP